MSQVDRIEAILKAQGYVDNFYCIHNRISLRLGARIWDLKQRGWVFRTEEREDKNTIYWVVSEPALKQTTLM